MQLVSRLVSWSRLCLFLVGRVDLAPVHLLEEGKDREEWTGFGATLGGGRKAFGVL